MKNAMLTVFSLAFFMQNAFANVEDYCRDEWCDTVSVPEAGAISMLALGVAAVAAIRFIKSK